MESKHRIVRAASWMSLATSSSRVLGLIRDSLNADLFGAGPISDAFIVAFRIPNLLRDLLAEGALSSAFIPFFSKVKEQQGDQEAWRLAALMLNALLIALTLVVLLGEIFSPQIVSLLAPGFLKNVQEFNLTVFLNRLLFPFIACMALGALFTCTLNARGEFVLPAFAPALTNVMMILAGLFLCPRLGQSPETQVVGWAAGALLGGVVQFAVHIPPVIKGGFRPFWQWPFKDERVLKIFKLMLPAVFTLSLNQINLVINTIIASFLPSGSMTYLNYGNRLMQFPLGIFGVAIATASLPTLSTNLAKNQNQEFKNTVSFGMKLMIFISLPAMTGLIVLAEPINQLLYHWGRFRTEDAHAVALASICYAFMILPACFAKLLVPAFYALEDPAKPVKITIWMFFLNLISNILLVITLPLRYRYLGLAMSTTMVSLVNALCLIFTLRTKVGLLGGKSILMESLKAGLAALGMGFSIFIARYCLHLFAFFSSNHRSILALETFLLIGLGIAVYFFIAQRLGMQEWKAWFKKK